MRPDRLGLLGAVALSVFALLFEVLGGSRLPPDESGPSQRRSWVEGPPQVRRPAPLLPSDQLPPISASDPTVVIAPSRKGNSTGTAFSIGNGLWLTARHVLERCRDFGIQTGSRRVERGFDAILSPRHDLAVFRTDRRVSPLAFGKAQLARGQRGYHFGFPQGNPADVQSRLLGRMKISRDNRSPHREPVIAWAESSRVPEFRGSLGGISGGPAVDGSGKIVGVTVAGSVRRGRIFTTAPAGLQDILEQARVPTGAKHLQFTVDPSTYPEIGRALRGDLVVTKVLCWVN